MAIQIDDNRKRAYIDGFAHLDQQMSASLANAVMQENKDGKDFSMDRITDPNDVLAVVPSRHADTEISDMEHSRRVGFNRPYARAFMLDTEDKVRLMADPTSHYVQEIMGEYERTKEDAILNVMLGNTYGGETGSTTIALPAAQHIAAGGTALTLDKLRQALRILIAGNVDVNREELFLCTSSYGFQDLISDSGLVSRDFVPFSPNYDGKVLMACGFKVIQSERLSVYAGGYTTTAPSSSSRPALAFAKSAVIFNKVNLEVSIDKRPDKNNNWQILLKAMMGALRLHDGRVVDIRYVEG